ncbi:MAG: acyltransferase [Sulfurimonas sp.]|nr:acyltransferase [Sulfurimonas sp.]
MSSKFTRYDGLDFVRVIAVMLVSFAHFTYTAHHRTDISGIKNSTVIVESSEWALLLPDEFLSMYFSTYLGTIGVSLFFVTTGFLMPLMMQRYTRGEFFLNRVFRIYPTLFVSVALTWGLVFWYGGEEFGVSNFWHSVFLTFGFWGVGAIIPVLWTLVIEMFFYALCFGLGRFTPLKLLFSIGGVAAFSLVAHFWHVGALEYVVKYLLIILVGSALYFLHLREGEMYKNIAMVILACGAWFLVFFITEPAAPYAKMGSIIIVMGVVGFFLFYPIKSPVFIKLLADIVYPMYLLHFTFGLIVMIEVKEFFSQNAYVMVLFAYLAVFVMSLLVHYGVEKPFYFYIKHKLKRGLK